MALHARKPTQAERLTGPARKAGVLATPQAGQPIAEQTRGFFERGFAHDFSAVRVHADDRAASRADALGARALTRGNDIFFGRGEYRPQAPEGRELIAHELAHVVQQRNGRQAGMSVPGDVAEREADSAAGRVAEGGEAGAIRAAAPAIARQPKPGADYIEFDLGTDEKGNTTITSVDVTDNPLWIDRKITAAGYNIWLGGFVIWLDEAGIGDIAKGIKVPEEDVVFTSLKVRQINNFIYNSRAEARAAVAAMPKSTDGVVPYAYYWGAGGLLVVPTVICDSTAPKAAGTMWQARVDYANYVTRELTVLAISMVGMKVLTGIYGWARGGGGGGGEVPTTPKGKGGQGPKGGTKPPAKPPAKAPQQPKPAAETEPVKPAPKTEPVKPAPKAEPEPQPATKPQGQTTAGDVPKSGPDLFTKTAQQPGGQAEKVKYFDKTAPALRPGWKADKMGTATDGSVVYKGDKQQRALIITPKGEVYTGTWGEHVNLKVSTQEVSITVDWSKPGLKKW